LIDPIVAIEGLQDIEILLLRQYEELGIQV
jgi:hypothetical protein